MTVNRLQLRSLVRMVHAEPGVGTDADLLARYARDGDEVAFSALVQRYGRLVWAVCRHQTRSDADAEDGFQATFLVLARNAGSIRKSAALGAWLHGVAYRVCAKARKAARARSNRERAVSRGEAGSDVPESAWDRALAAVHDELSRLPESLRVPFVLCCLEGKGTTAAAAQLGWKIGTLSGRLTRAKDLLLARLEARGLSAGALAAAAITGGAASAPAALADKVLALSCPGAVIPKSISALSQGVLEMSLSKAKLLAAGLIVACGLGTTVGTQWVARADDPKPAGNAPTPATVSESLLQAIQANPDDVARMLLFDVINQQPTRDSYVGATARWEYDFVQVSALSKSRFVKFLGDRESSGWEFHGQVTLAGEDAPVWMFRRPAKAKAVEAGLQDLSRYLNVTGQYAEAANQNQQNQARIRQLEAELARLRGQAINRTPDVKQERIFQSDELPLGAAEMADILRRLALKRGYERLECSVVTSSHVVGVAAGQGSRLLLRGDKESVAWAAGVISVLMRK